VGISPLMEVDELTWLVSRQAVDVLPGNDHLNDLRVTRQSAITSECAVIQELTGF